MWNIINFEVFRALKKKSFWYASIAPVLIILAVLGIEKLSIQNSQKNAATQVQNFTQSAKISVLDDSGLIDKHLLAAQHIGIEPNKDAGISAVKSGQVSAFFYYPQKPEIAGIEVYAQDQGISLTQPYNEAAQQLLKQSVTEAVSSSTGNSTAVQILEKIPGVTAVTYKDGSEINNLTNVIAPGIFAAIFFLVVILLSYTMISSTAEEKTNKTAEILLTSIKARTLILGKIISLIILGLVQIAVLSVPFVIGYVFFPSRLGLSGGIALGSIPINPVTVTFAALFFVVGMVMYIGFVVGLGAMFPGGNDASRFMGIAIIWNFIPLYAITSVISSPHALVVTVFTYFPLTAPSTVLLRNAVGSLSIGESLGALAVLILSACLAIWFAVKAFRYGGMEYGRRVGLKELLRN
ncbi:MAG: ABC transporter permease [Candidatus Doudnabacteria bacterium]|nr:ABC transporter permease [Candidatus Doudnabacteria bacterium]